MPVFGLHNIKHYSLHNYFSSMTTCCDLSGFFGDSRGGRGKYDGPLTGQGLRDRRIDPAVGDDNTLHASFQGFAGPQNLLLHTALGRLEGHSELAERQLADERAFVWKSAQQTGGCGQKEQGVCLEG